MLMAKYTPTVALLQDNGVKTTSTAYGMVRFISAEKITP
jgi:hypothetical protein